MVRLPFSPLLLFVAAIWSLAWKGFALWFSARGGQKGWFIALVILNTLGILEIIYLVWFRPQSFELEERTDEPSSAA